MKKVILSLAVVFTLSTVMISCRENKKEVIEVNVDDDDLGDAIDDAGDAIEDAVDDVEDAVTGEDDN